MKKVCLKKINLLLGTIIAAMGFSMTSCVLEYGCPPLEYIDPEDTVTNVVPLYGCPTPQENAPMMDNQAEQNNKTDNSIN